MWSAEDATGTTNMALTRANTPVSTVHRRYVLLTTFYKDGEEENAQ